ncbi:MAG: glycosyltransferase [Oscillatoriophycideae cyanobacterium NC_groundwater_1537_Pr4_S-0.65um_50_18]|nr:glycosyltransferase [Oscillatoriophycideae cyanobacterium NC_groundwater_1537_Pr4_S-0.65um_50_18]
MSRSLRILQIVPSISRVYGGPSQMVLGFAPALAAQGAEVTLLTTDANGDVGQAPLAVPLNCAIDQEGYQIRYFRCAPFRRYKFSVGLLTWLARHAHEFDIAHIHALFSPVSSAAATIARVQKLPYVLRPLGTLDPADLQKKRQLKRLYGMAIERPNLAAAAALHFTSDQEAKVSDRFGVVTRDWVMPLGVKAAMPIGAVAIAALRQQLGISSDCPLILFMSRIDPKKGLDLLLPALEQLQREGHAFQLVLAGENPQDASYEHQIHAQVQASPLADCTTLTGFVSGDTKTALLQAADLFVLPSYYENFGIAVAEAMVAGAPVVISDQVHIWPAIAESQSGWVASCTIAAFTDALRQALLQPAERRQRGANAQAYATQHYSWEAIARQMMAAYAEIL